MQLRGGKLKPVRPTQRPRIDEYTTEKRFIAQRIKQGAPVLQEFPAVEVAFRSGGKHERHLKSAAVSGFD
jgi:hypothetical protein